MKLELSLIKIDGGTQARAGIDQDTVREYAEAIEDGSIFPSLTVFHDGTAYWLADGFHRYHAYKSLEALDVDVEVKQGERREAVLYSVGANATHGLRRTNEDKRRAVQVLLEDKEWSQWSDREIARRAGVGNKFVGDMRRAICVPNTDAPVEVPQIERTVKRGDTEYRQNTVNIGRSQPTSYSPPVTPDEPDEDDRPEYDPYADEGLEPVQAEAEIVTDETEGEEEPYIPDYVSNPRPSTFEVRPLPGPKPKEPPFVVWLTLLGKVRGQGHRSLIDALNSIENQTQEQALENQVLDLIEMLRASLKQAEKERKTLEVTA